MKGVRIINKFNVFSFPDLLKRITTTSEERKVFISNDYFFDSYWP